MYMTRNFLSPSWKDLLKGYGNIYFFFGLSTRPFKVIAISVAKCIVPYLVSEILKDKWRWPSAILFYN